MLLTVPCYPSPCFLICLKMVLPLKRRVSGLFLWRRCVSLPRPCAHECLLLPPSLWGPCMRLHAAPCPPHCLHWFLPHLYLSSPFLFGGSREWALEYAVRGFSSERTLGGVAWHCVLLSPAADSELVILKHFLTFCFLLCPSLYFCAFVGLQDLLSCFENKFVSIIQVKDG